MIPVYFDSMAFLARIDAIRKERSLSKADLERQSGVDRTIIYRAACPGRDGLSAHAVAALVLWSGLSDITPYIKRYEDAG